MATPVHQYASVLVGAPAPALHQRLRTLAIERVDGATATGLARLQPFVSLWGLTPTALPSVDTHTLGHDEFGAVEVTWSGDEEATTWPSMTARLLVTPDATEGSRLVLVSPRSPGAELATTRLGRVHRQRLVHSTVQQFLADLADELGRAPAAARHGTGAVVFDQRPVFVHHLRRIDDDPHRVAAQLRTHVAGLAHDATRVAVDSARTALAAGRFRLPATPRVATTPGHPGQLAAVHIRWHADEEATGWPAITLGLAIEAHDLGTRLAVVSPRPPGHDLTRNRVDKQARHDLLQHAAGHLAEALCAHLGHRQPPPTPQPHQPVATAA